MLVFSGVCFFFKESFQASNKQIQDKRKKLGLNLDEGFLGHPKCNPEKTGHSFVTMTGKGGNLPRNILMVVFNWRMNQSFTHRKWLFNQCQTYILN